MPQGICFPYFIFTYYSPIAQLVERLAVNQDVTGSSPVGEFMGCLHKSIKTFIKCDERHTQQ